MLIEYKIKNFKSFFNETELSMVSSNSDKTHLENLAILNEAQKKLVKENVSKLRIIYGSNASGKSSLLHSINFIKNFFETSNLMLENSKIQVSPYKFCDNYKDNASEFSVVFIKDNLKYKYLFSCDYEKIINERLDIYYSNKPTNIFNRVNTNEYEFSHDKKLLNEIKEKNTKNKLFLVTAATWNYEKVKPVVEYFHNNVIFLDSLNNMTVYDMDYVKSHGDFDEFKRFCLDFLNDADISIDDFSYTTKKFSESKETYEVMKFLYDTTVDEETKKTVNFESVFGDKNLYNFKVKHKVIKDKEEKFYELKLDEESLGTIKMFGILPLMFYTLKDGKILFIDEMDRSLHSLMIEFILNKFLNKENNPNNAQIICNMHNTNLMDLKKLRRDEILFVEKDYKTGISELYSLSDFSPRKDDNVEKSYLLGRYGAIPFIEGE